MRRRAMVFVVCLWTGLGLGVSGCGMPGGGEEEASGGADGPIYIQLEDDEEVEDSFIRIGSVNFGEDGSLYVTGSFEGTLRGQEESGRLEFVRKYDEDRNLEWTNILEYQNSLFSAEHYWNGRFYYASGPSVWVFDSEGNEVGSGEDLQVPEVIEPAGDGDVLFASGTHVGGRSKDFRTQNWAVEVCSEYDRSDRCRPSDLQRGPGGAIYATLTKKGRGNPGNYWSRRLTKVSSSKEEAWMEVIDESAATEMRGLTVDDSGIHVVGFSSTLKYDDNNGGDDLFFASYSAEGEKQSINLFGTKHDEVALETWPNDDGTVQVVYTVAPEDDDAWKELRIGRFTLQGEKKSSRTIMRVEGESSEMYVDATRSPDGILWVYGDGSGIMYGDQSIDAEGRFLLSVD